MWLWHRLLMFSLVPLLFVANANRRLMGRPEMLKCRLMLTNRTRCGREFDALSGLMGNVPRLEALNFDSLSPSQFAEL